MNEAERLAHVVEDGWYCLRSSGDPRCASVGLLCDKGKALQRQKPWVTFSSGHHNQLAPLLCTAGALSAEASKPVQAAGKL